MRKKIESSASFLWATAIGGVFFLLPLAVLLFLLGQVYSIVLAVAVPLHDWLPLNTPLGIALLFGLAVAGLVLLCFASGIAARRAIGKKFTGTLEKQLATVFPKYTIYKDLLAGNLKHRDTGPSLVPVLVQVEEGYRVAFESDRLPGGLVVVFFPGAPDTWTGSVLLVPEERVHPTELEFGDALGIFEQLGRQSQTLLQSIKIPCDRQPDRDGAI